MRYIKTSDDGSNTIYNDEIDEHYHSHFGAITESKHIFIQAGMQHFVSNEIRILEIGFGTGLNALLALDEAIKSKRHTYYETIELFPLDLNIIAQLNYPGIVNFSLSNDFMQMHQCKPGELLEINPYFSFRKIHGDALKAEFSGNFNVIFFDAFSPEKQPELWSHSVFEKLSKHLESNGILTTYCVKGMVKRTLKELGFKIELLPGPPGKRHILRGIKL
jgi:tRNA U34 5-methylaminomethyl-2-thiouridine-forming methyltransferase MnmC